MTNFFLSVTTGAWLQKCIMSEVSSRSSARAQAAAGQQQIANHCWLTAAAVVCIRRDKPNEYRWSKVFDLEQNLQHQSTCLNQKCTDRSTEKSGSLYLNLKGG